MDSTRRVLIVDDDPDILGFVQVVLEEEGYKTLTAKNGLEALDVVRTQAPDLVLLDLYMPVLDGWGLSRVLRDEDKLDVPIVVMTADQGAIGSVYERGLQGCISKPFDLEELVSCVAHFTSLTAV